MDYLKSACAVKSPRMGSISALVLSTSASTTQDTGVTTGGPMWVTFICDVAWYVTFSADGTTTITDPDATAVSGNGRTWRVGADSPLNVLISSKVDRYFKARGSDAGTLRWYASNL